MSLVFGINHGCVNTPLLFASTLLDRNAGYAGSALFNLFRALSALFASVPVVMIIGQQKGLSLGMLLSSVSVAFSAFSVWAPMGSWLQWATFLPGSCVGGIAGSILWTAQGGYLDRSVSVLVEATREDRRDAVSWHTATFAVHYLVFEAACKLLSALALKCRLEPWLVFMVGLALAGASTIACTVFLLDLGRAPEAGTAATTNKLLKAMELWPDPTLWCLSLTNLTFGFAAAYMNGHVNAAYTKPQLGAHYVGIFATVTALVAAAVSYACGAAVNTLGSKVPVMLFGSLCFMAIPALSLLTGFSGWGTWLVVPFILQGCGRAVYESTNKAVFVDFYPGAKAEGAFANTIVQTCIAFAFCFCFSSVLIEQALAGIVLALAASSFPSYLIAKELQRKSSEPDAEDSMSGSTSGS